MIDKDGIDDKMKKSSYISYEDWVKREKEKFKQADKKYSELKSKSKMQKAIPNWRGNLLKLDLQ